MSGIYSPYGNCCLDTGKRNADDDQSEAHAFGGKSHDGACPAKSRCLRLSFSNDISHPVYTGIPFEKQRISLDVVVIDAADGNVVNHGPEASAIVEIVVLSEDFNCNDENWTLEEFNSRIVKSADGRYAKKSLLCGTLRLPLKEGIASVSKISFRHTSQHMRTKEFRLGARIVDHSNDTRVREAKTKPFTVKDRRIISKKRYPPSLSDEVWRLKNIGKGGPFHKRLSKRNIDNVEDFLTEFNKNPEKLRKILLMNKSSMWEATVNHAQTCRLGGTQDFYPRPNSQPRMGVVFNGVTQAPGLYSDSKFIPIDQLSDTQKANSHELVASEYGHWDEVENFDDNASVLHGSSLLSNTQNPSYSGNIPNHGGCDFGTSYVVETGILSPGSVDCFHSWGDYWGLGNDCMGLLSHIPPWPTGYDTNFSDVGHQTLWEGSETSISCAAHWSSFPSLY